MTAPHLSHLSPQLPIVPIILASSFGACVGTSILKGFLLVSRSPFLAIDEFRDCGLRLLQQAGSFLKDPVRVIWCFARILGVGPSRRVTGVLYVFRSFQNRQKTPYEKMLQKKEEAPAGSIHKDSGKSPIDSRRSGGNTSPS